MCKFCEQYDFGRVTAKIEDGLPGIHFAGGSYRFPKEMQFNFCPICGKKLIELSKDRKYVIVSNEHSSWPNGALLFWGRRTDDNQRRSFGGYTTRFDQCEWYTRDEIEKFRGGLKDEYPFFDEIHPLSPCDFKKYAEVVCTLEELESLGWTHWNVIMRA